MSLSPLIAQPIVQPTNEQDRFLPEGPRQFDWNGRATLGWVNIQTANDSKTGTLWTQDWETGQLQSFPLNGRPGFWIPTDLPGVVLVGLTKQIGLFDLNRSVWQPLATIPDEEPRTIINDAEVSPDGRYVIFGTKDVEFREPLANLYLFDVRNHFIHLIASGQTCSNGKIITSDGDDLILYDIDTPTRQVKKYRIRLSPFRTEFEGIALELNQATGFPDGMIALENENALVAFYNPDLSEYGLAIQYDLKTGAEIQRVLLPGSPRVTCPLFMEPHGKRWLIFTTATEGMGANLRAQCPNAGAIFGIEVGNISGLKSVLVKIKGD